MRALDVDGYVVVPDALTPNECLSLSDEIDRVWFEFSLADLGLGEPGVRFVGNLLQYAPLAQLCVEHPVVVAAATAILQGPPRLHLINGRTPGPGALGQPLHDLSRRRGRPFDKCNAIYCLDEFTERNGATRVIPGSHLDDRPALQRLTDPMAPHPDEVLVTAPKGAVIVHNSHLIHSGRPNRSGDHRHSIHAAFTRTDTPTHQDWTALPREVRRALSPGTLALLGLT